MVIELTADLARFSFRRKVYINGVNYLVNALNVQLSNGWQLMPAEVSLSRV